MNAKKSIWPSAMLGTLMMLVLVSGPAFPQEKTGPRVEVEIAVHQETSTTDADGQTVIVKNEGGPAAPGDILTYTLRARNIGDSPALDALIEDPIPGGTTLLPDSLAENGSTISASIDGGDSWKSFPVFVAAGKDASGETLYQQASGEDYTHLRWLLNEPLAPGTSKEVSFKVQVR